jgi:hypothetical protein
MTEKDANKVFTHQAVQGINAMRSKSPTGPVMSGRIKNSREGFKKVARGKAARPTPGYPCCLSRRGLGVIILGQRCFRGERLR